MKIKREHLQNILGDNITAFIHGLRFIWLIYYKPLPDPEVVYLKKISKRLENTLAIDVGANGANWTKVLSDLVGDSGEVLGFEPHPYYFKATKWACRLMALNNVKMFQMALSDTESELHMKVRNGLERFKGTSHIVNSDVVRAGRASDFQLVNALPLDDFLNEDTQTVGVIKIDVEGHEMSVLLGAKNILRANRPIVIFELNGDETTELKEFESFFEGIDYQIVTVDHLGNLNSAYSSSLNKVAIPIEVNI